MTLTKKMLLGVLGLLLAVFIGTYLITIHNSKNFFVQQMQNNAQDTATSLGLSLSHAMGKNDLAFMTSMVQAVFDRGYFKTIEVHDINDKLLVARYLQKTPQLAPQWFSDWMDWPDSKQSALVMDGWNQRGEVSVTSDNAQASFALWRQALYLFYAYLAFAIITSLIAIFFVKWLMRPLIRVIDQADAICNREFPIETNIPKTPELKKVTNAMNQMVTRVKNSFEEQINQMEILRFQSYQDNLTNLGNRRYFDQQINSLLTQEEDFSPGYIIFVSIEGLEKYNLENGYQKGDQLIVDVAKIATNAWSKDNHSLVTRTGGAAFAIITHEGNGKTFIHKCEEFNHSLQNRFEAESLCKIYVAVVPYHLHQNFDELMDQIDTINSEAHAQEKHLAMSPLINANITEAIDKKFISRALDDHKFRLYKQKIVANVGILHEEIFIRLIHDDEEIRAGRFVAIAEKTGLADRVDRYVLAEVLKKNLLINQVVALNLSTFTIIQDDLREEYLQLLSNIDVLQRANLNLEMSESIVLEHFDKVLIFTKAVQKLGIKVGVDQVGVHFLPMQYLNQLPIHYLKLHGSLIQDIDDNKNKQFFIHYFCEMANTLDIQVIATQIETNAQWKTLQGLRVKWGQGRFLSDLESVL